MRTWKTDAALATILVVAIVAAWAQSPAEVDKPSAAAQQPAAAAAGRKKSDKPKYSTENLRGKIVFYGDAMQRLYGVKVDPDAAETSVVLETADGKLHPILKDVRSRGFWIDGRLRGVELELMVRRYEGSPFVQVIRVCTIKNGRKYELDYWCDICAIVMYELKECECCQGPTRLRERLVEEEAANPAPAKQPTAPK